MIIVDRALKAREEQDKPIRVGMIGAGFMGQGLTNQIENSVPGMRMAAIYNRHPERAFGVYRYAGREPVAAGSQSALDEAVRKGQAVVAEDAMAICRSPEIDVVVDVTGSVDFGARVILEAFAHQKPVVLMNAEVDATIGPILQVYGRKHGAILSACDGDEPGLQMNLVRWVQGLGLTPRAVVNVKGLQDPYRNPTTQKGWAERWGQNAAMVTSFADGSKISFEQTIVANATGFKVLSRGMSRGRKYDGSVMDIHQLYDVEQLRALGGVVDYTVGPALTKAFVPGRAPRPQAAPLPRALQDGDGPLYPFWMPYHLVHFETPFSIARVVLFGDELAPAAGRPGGRGVRGGQARSPGGRGARRVRHVHDLRRGGERRGDERRPVSARGSGRGLQAQAATSPRTRCSPTTTWSSPTGRIADLLRAEQYVHFRGETWLQDLLKSQGQHRPQKPEVRAPGAAASPA